VVHREHNAAAASRTARMRHIAASAQNKSEMVGVAVATKEMKAK